MRDVKGNGMENTDVVETESGVEVDVMASQGIEGPSDAELRGEDVETPEAKTEEETEAKNEPEAKTEESTEVKEVKEVKEVEPEEDEVSTEKVTESSDPIAGKPPKGFVPLEAIHEVRGENRYLKEQIQTLQTQMHTLQVKSEEKPVEVADDFEVLTDDQFEDLADDNPAQAAIYLRKLAAHETNQRDAADEVKHQAAFEEAYDNIIDTSVAEIEKVAPGIFDEDSKVQTELMDFAEDLGFTEDLYYLTNPSTKIILPGESEPLLLGEQAASILGMLVNAKSKTAAPDTSALEAKLRTDITAELMKKFKTPDTEEYRGLNQVPKVDGETPELSSLTGKVLTTDQLLKLSDADQEAYLAGN